MNPCTHFFVSWSFAETFHLDQRDQAVVTWVGFAPDLDGLGILADMAARLLHFNVPGFYEHYHHALLHGLFGAVLLAFLGAGVARRGVKTFLWGMAAVHLHLLCDLLGSRGQTAADIWPINYLSPFSGELSLSWPGQWPLDAWQNILLTVGLIGFILVRAVTQGHSPVSLVSSRTHGLFVETVRARWTRLRKGV